MEYKVEKLFQRKGKIIGERIHKMYIKFIVIFSSNNSSY